jgi:hypothetical protein
MAHLNDGYHSLMATVLDIQRSAQELVRMYNEVAVPPSVLEQMSELVRHQEEITLALRSSQVDQLYANLSELSQSMLQAEGQIEQLSKNFSDLTSRVNFEFVAAFQARIPDLTLGLSEITNRVATLQLEPVLGDIRAVLEQYTKLTVPAGLFVDAAMVDDARIAAVDALEQVDAREREALDEVIDSLAIIEEAADAEQRPDHDGSTSREDAIFVLIVLQTLFTFLASQDEITGNAFEDAATVGAALTHVWQYAGALILFLVAYSTVRKDKD